MNNLKLNANAYSAKTISLKISDTQINKHLRDPRVHQLKDERCSLYLKFNKKRMGGTWVLMEYKDGTQFGHRIGKWPALPAKHIMEVVGHAKKQLSSGKPIDYSGFETVDQVVNWHIEREFKLKQSSKARLNNLKSMGELHLCSIFEGHPALKLEHQTIDSKLIQPMFKQGYSVSYVRANFNLLKTAYSTAKRLGQINTNPLVGVGFKQFFGETFSVSAAQVKGCRLNTDQMPVLLMNAQQQHPMARMLVTMIAAHGSRIGETRMAKWQHIDFTRRCWIIPKENTKNGKAMEYPLTPGMVELLRSYQMWLFELGYKGHFLFPASKRDQGPINSAAACEWVRAVSKGQWTSHDIRKRARSIWLELGIDYIICESLLNHSRDMLDQAYIHTHMTLQKIEALETYHNWLNSCWQDWLLPISISSRMAA
ncbi:site-specific integrase [Photobacterium sp. SP02]|uniref:site-specific integrase n=1 Tax=Photobacterium sp. SP02 TaxID=3032280 RepID=UPI00314556A9